jgi:4-amino-4-deoxy-L-arabinose transferase-like glycosyltransferase
MVADFESPRARQGSQQFESGGWPSTHDIEDDPADQKLFLLTLAVLLTCRLCFQLGAAPLPDEAYYWLWGLHPSLSYYDHPPLHAWLQGVDARIFGWSVIGLRFLTWPTTIGTIAIAIWWRRRNGASIGGSYGLATAALYFSSPLIFIYGMMVDPDHLLIFLSYLSASFFILFLNEFAANKRQLNWQLYAGAFTLGLAALAKYNAVFLGLGVACAVITLPALRPLMRSAHLYAAAGLSALLQLPVLYWNAANGGASFRYNLWDRLHFDGLPTVLSTMAAFVIASAVMLSPFLVPALIRFLGRPPRQLAATTLHAIGTWTFWCSSVTFLGLCLVAYVHFYWNVEAYLLFLPLALGYLDSARMLRAHLIYGMVFAALFTFNYTALPLAAVVGQKDFESSRAFGWDEIGARVAAARKAYGAKFVASSDWQASSQLAFALHDPDVKCFDYKTSQFVFWADDVQRKGQDAIVLVDEPQLAALDAVIRPRFATLELIDTIPVIRFGRTLTTYRLYRGISFAGNAS